MVGRAERSVVDEFKKLARLDGETELEFIMRAHLVFQDTGQEPDEKDYVSISFGRFASKWKEKNY